MDFPGKYVLINIRSDVKNLAQQNYERFKEEYDKTYKQITLLNL